VTVPEAAGEYWVFRASGRDGFLPSIGAVNPELTAMATALWVGDQIRQRMAAAAVLGG
jgi:choline dehydrogenase-like flavoprotein